MLKFKYKLTTSGSNRQLDNHPGYSALQNLLQIKVQRTSFSTPPKSENRCSPIRRKVVLFCRDSGSWSFKSFIPRPLERLRKDDRWQSHGFQGASLWPIVPLLILRLRGPDLTHSALIQAGENQGGHNMSGLRRLSSSSDTVRFPRYQNIHRTRLRNMSRGPDRTKKSQ